MGIMLKPMLGNEQRKDVWAFDRGREGVRKEGENMEDW